MFAGCAKFQRLFSEESCTIKEIIFVLKKWGGEIIKKLDKDDTLENPDDRKFESCAGMFCCSGIFCTVLHYLKILKLPLLIHYMSTLFFSNT
jgi:hypothetical protein